MAGKTPCGFINQRNKELYNTLTSEIQMHSDCLLIKDLYSLAVSRPSTRFWVSPTRASIMFGNMIRGVPNCYMSSKKQEMYDVLFDRMIIYIDEHPECSRLDAAYSSVYGPAPSFFMEASSAMMEISKYIHKCKEKKKI